MIVYLIGVVFSAIGFYMVYDANYFRKYARPYTGKIIGYKKRISNNSKRFSKHYNYYPIVEYWDEDDQRHEFVSDMNKSKGSTKVTVLVLDANHVTARIKQDSRLVLAYAFGVVGPIVLLIGIFVMSEQFIINVVLAILLITALFYIFKAIGRSSRKKKVNLDFLYENDEEVIRSSEAPKERRNIDHQNMSIQIEGASWFSPLRALFSAIFLLLSAAVLWFGLNKAADVAAANENRIKVEGMVTEDKVHREGGADIHTLSITFKPLDSESLQVIELSGIYPKEKVGDRVKVTYDKDDYASAKLYATDKIINAFRIFVLVIAGVLFIIGLIILPKKK